MAWTAYQKMLAVVMVITGSINSLTTKWADTMQSKGSDGQIRYFDHPFVQTASMFMGEMLCLLTFKAIQRFSRNAEDNSLTRGNQNFNPIILMPAAMFDLVGTSIMYVGLTLTYVSSFQMFRGSVIVFVAVLSMTFLNRTVIRREWLGILYIIAGLVVVAMTDIFYPSELSEDSVGQNPLITKDLIQTVVKVLTAAHMLVYELVNIIFGLVVVGLTDAIFQDESSKGTNSLITGDLLIIMAQVVTATQMVYEEKYVAGLNIPPLQAVGWEGVFGFSVLSVLLGIFYWIPAPPHFGNNARGTVEDVVDGLVQIGNNSLILLSIMGSVVSIAFFNFAGISVTKEMSATTRMVLDSVRTFVIWMASLALRWQAFHWPQLIGFGVLIYGMCEYNGLGLYDRCVRRRPEPDHGESEVVNTDANAESDDVAA